MSISASDLPSVAYPGLSLAPATQYAPGPGTHVYNGHIVASLLGRPSITPSPSSSTSSKSSKHAPKEKSTITIPRILPSPTYAPIPSSKISNTNILPSVGCTVLARVLRVRTRQVDVGILCVSASASASASNPSHGHSTNSPPPPPQGNKGASVAVDDSTTFHPCADDYPAVIRREDIRATEKDKVVCSEGFRVGDVLKGEVISVGDQANYYLSTARNELGVVMARGEATGAVMAPVSWREFVDLGTGMREGRKVAKPF